jgi:hypothetical protein
MGCHVNVTCDRHIVYEKMTELYKSPSLTLDDDFMMNIFSEYLQELPPFEEYWKLTLKKANVSCCL